MGNGMPVFTSWRMAKTFPTLSSLLASQLTLLFSVPWGERAPAASQEIPMPKIKNNNINKRTISHFLMLVRGKSHC